MVSVSRRAGPPHTGHVVSTHSLMPARGDSPVPLGSYPCTSGSTTGSWLSGTGTVPHVGQWIMGIGAPQ